MTEESILIIAIIIALIIALALFFLLYIFIPAEMASKRGRSVLGWVLLFWIISPFWGIIVLLVLGDSKKKIREDIMEEIHRN